MTHTLALAVGNTVRAELARRRLSQTDLAAVLGITQTSVSRKLLGRVDFRLSELVAIAEFLGIPLEELVADQAAAAS